MKQIIATEHGSPQVLKLAEGQTSPPKSNQIKVKNYAVGVNYTDIYLRKGDGTAGTVKPYTPGKEGAGVVLETGDKVTRFKAGDRVVYTQSLGAYGEEHTVNEGLAFHLPDEMDFELAASSTLRGLTAHYLIHQSYAVKQGDTVLVHAATGGVGSILVQWAKHKGATVIATVHSDDKKAKALELGADWIINTQTEDIARKVAEYTQGKKCDAVYDGLGKAVVMPSLRSLRKFGYYINYGMVTGAVNLDLWTLAENGSVYATFGDLAHFEDDYAVLSAMAQDYFNAVLTGVIKLDAPMKLPLSEAAKAHEIMENGQRSSPLVLIP